MSLHWIPAFAGMTDCLVLLTGHPHLILSLLKIIDSSVAFGSPASAGTRFFVASEGISDVAVVPQRLL